MTPQQNTRRQFLKSASLASAAAFAPRVLLSQAATPPVPELVRTARAQAADAKITLASLRCNVSVLMGSGGNIAVLNGGTGKDGKLLVDSGYSTSRPHIEAALLTLDATPVRRLIDTHWHFDHTDGNEWLHSVGATITAHQNTLNRLSTTQTIAAFNATFPPAPAEALPTDLFPDDDIILSNGSTVMLHHYDPAHTDTDISVHFLEADVLHTGDTWFNDFYPFIDYSTGGSIDGMIKATDYNLSQTTPSTIIIPGHGPVGTRAQLRQYHDVLAAIRDNVAGLKAKGMSVDQVIAAKPTATFDDPWGKGFMNPDTFVRLVYQGV